MRKRLQILLFLLGILIPFEGMAQSFDVDRLVISSGDTIYHEGLYDFKEYLYIYIDSIVDRPIEEVAGKPFQSKFHHDTTDFFKRWIGDRGKGKACVWAGSRLSPG